MNRKPLGRVELTVYVLCFIAMVVGALGVGLFAQQPVNMTKIGNNTPIYDPCLDPSKAVPVDIDLTAASGNTTLIAISGSTKIYFCSAKIQGGAAGTIKFVFGTGSNCASFPTNIDTTSIVSAGDGGVIGTAGAGTFALSAAGQALCIIRSASMTAHGHVRARQE